MNDLLVRPEFLARTPRNLVIALGIATSVGFLLGRAPETAPRVERISVAAPAPQVTVQMPTIAAAGVQVTPAPTAEPAAEPVPVAPPAPRPLAPHLFAECIAADFQTDAEVPASCHWDNGFPAVSADAQLVATCELPDDGGRGYPGLSIHFVDASTGKLAKTILVLSPDEYVEPDDNNAAAVVRMRKTISARVAKAQAALDAGGYRTMTLLANDVGEQLEPTPDATVHDAIYAEISGDSARMLDPSTNRAIWQHTFTVPSPHPVNDDTDCGGWNLVSMSMWWDPTTRLVLASQWYTTGGCICSTVERVHVARVPLANGPV